MVSLPTVSLLFLLGLIETSAVKIGDMDQGAEFTKCVKISDYQTKTLNDDITLSDRETNGCCPKGTVPGTKLYASYQSPQIVCGFQTDGTIKFSITTGSKSKCVYNKCYINKQNLACADDTKQLLNGCCAATTKANTGFPATCKNYWYTQTFNSTKVNYCTTYHKDYGTKGWRGTKEKTDDQKDGKLQPAKIYTYTACDGGSGGAGGSSGAGGGTTANANSEANGGDRAVMGAMSIFAIAIARIM